MILPLSWFYPITKDDGVRVTPFCKACLPEMTGAMVEYDKKELSTARVNAIREMSGSLKKILNKPITREEGPSIVELATRVLKAIADPETGEKGQGAFAEMLAREVGQVYEVVNPCIKNRVLRHKWATLIVDMQATLAKLKNEDVKVGDLNDDQLAALLEFASKQAVLDSPEIRATLLEDTDIRAILLKELGGSMVFTDAATSVVTQEHEVLE